MTNQSAAAVAESTERTWPSPEFLKIAQHLRRELDSAIQAEQATNQRITEIQDRSDRRGLPLALAAGGEDKLKKLSGEQDAAHLSVYQKREALRRFLESERARFFLLRDTEHERLRAGISEQLACARAAAASLCALLETLLGTEAEAASEEKLIRQWNREARKFNRTIPDTNVNGITRASGIDIGESVRGRIEGLLLADRNIRDLCRDVLARTAKQRERAAELEEAKVTQAEAIANPASLVEPF